MKIAIIGSGAAGISTASNIRRYDENIEITVLTLEKQVAYSPRYTYVLSGEVERFEDIVMYQPEDYLKKDIKIITSAEALKVTNSENKLKYRLKNRYMSTEKEISYDYLVIATGATSFIPHIEGTNLKGVFKIRTIEDGLEIKKWLIKVVKPWWWVLDS